MDQTHSKSDRPPTYKSGVAREFIEDRLSRGIVAFSLAEFRKHADLSPIASRRQLDRLGSWVLKLPRKEFYLIVSPEHRTIGVIMRRYENHSTIMTSNRPLEDWGKLLSDVPTAGAILDRFLHHAIAIAITGRSYRVKDSLPSPAENKKTKKPNEPLTAGAAS